MDFFFNFFASAPAETHSELDAEVMQIPVDFEGGNKNDGGCIVA